MANKEIDANTQAYLNGLRDFIDEALDDYVEARNAVHSSMTRVIDSLKMLGFSESQARTLAKGLCDAAYDASIRNDI